MIDENISVGDKVWTKVQMLLVDAKDTKTNEDCCIKLSRRAQVKIVALPDDNSGEGNYTCETCGGVHFYMTRDEFEVVNESEPE